MGKKEKKKKKVGEKMDDVSTLSSSREKKLTRKSSEKARQRESFHLFTAQRNIFRAHEGGIKKQVRRNNTKRIKSSLSLSLF
jgi:hypothetical protein